MEKNIGFAVAHSVVTKLLNLLNERKLKVALSKRLSSRKKLAIF